MQCEKCGYVENVAFDEQKTLEEYSKKNYYQTKNFTPRLNRHILEIKDKIMKHAQNNSVFLEIAPGKGDIALALAKEARFIYTIDPSIASLNFEKTSNMKHIQGFFSKEFLKEQIKEKVDFVVFRHLLEHIYRPKEFLQDIVEFLDDEAMIYLEVPNAHDILRYKRFIDIYHEHCGYYQKASIVNIMNELGCAFIEEQRYFDNQHLGLFFKKSKNFKQAKEPFILYDSSLKRHFDEEIKAINELLQKYDKIAIYGAGVQAHSLINHLSNENLSKIVCAFELNEDKVGKYMQNSNIIVKYPSKDTLKNLQCLIMAIPSHENHAYKSEILGFIQRQEFQGELIRMAKGIEHLIF